MVRVTLFFTLFVMLLGASGSAICQSIPPSYPGNYPAVRPCAPRQAVQPVARSVTVTVPMPQPPRLCGPPQYAPSPYCQPLCGPPLCAPSRCCQPPAATAPARPMPVRVDIAVRPETCDQRCPVPVVYRDPGFLGPIIRNTVGLVGATIAAPFRVAEMLLPLDPPCPPRRQCAPPCPVNCGYPQFAPKCPVPVTQPVYRGPVFTCAPCGPSVAPLPSCAPPPPCGPFMPPAVVELDEEPPCAPQSLLGGIMDLPSRLLQRGRLIGDLGRSPAGVLPCSR